MTSVGIILLLRDDNKTREPLFIFIYFFKSQDKSLHPRNVRQNYFR